MKKNYKKLGLDCLVILGGNGTHKTANLLREEGLNVVTLPKTIDNDIWGTDMTFGFQSAVDIATDAIDCIHTTAASHGRVFIVEVMGHKVGWLTLHAGIAGGADIILLPEIPYDVDKVIEAIEQARQGGQALHHSGRGRGRHLQGGCGAQQEGVQGKGPGEPPVPLHLLPSWLTRSIKKTGKEIRITVPGHTQRGGSPCPYDRVLSTRLGAAAANLILTKQYGNMVGIVNGEIVPVPLEEVAGKLKYVSPDSSIIKEAKSIGISFGD